MREFLQLELDKCLELKGLIDQVKQLESNELRALSSRIDHESNQRDIITIPPPPEKIRVPGLISPYLSKVSVPSDQGPKSSRKMRSSNDSSMRKASVPSNSIIEMRNSQAAKAKYDQIQS